MTVIDNAIYIDGKRAVVPQSLDQTFEELRTCTDTPGHCFCWIGLPRPSTSEIDAVAAEFNLHGLAVEDTITAPRVSQSCGCCQVCGSWRRAGDGQVRDLGG